MWWIGAAGAATLTVGPGQAYRGVGAAVAAASPGDTIELYAGTYPTSVMVDKDLRFVGVGAVVLEKAGGAFSVMFRLNADVTFEGLVFDGLSNGNCVMVESGAVGAPLRTIVVRGSTFRDCSIALDGGDNGFLDVETSIFERNSIGITSEGDMRVWRSGFRQNSIGVASFWYGEFVANAFVQNTDMGLSLDLREQRVIRNAFCGNGRSGAIHASTLSGDPNTLVEISHNRFWDNHATSGAAVDLGNNGYGGVQPVALLGNTFADNSGPAAAHVSAEGIALDLVNNTFALGAGASDAVAVVDGRNQYGQVLRSSLGGDHNLFWSNAGGDYGAPLVAADFGANTLWNADPRFTSYVANADCYDDLTTQPGSPAIDAGDPAYRDHRDGTRSDIGWVPFR